MKNKNIYTAAYPLLQINTEISTTKFRFQYLHLCRFYRCALVGTLHKCKYFLMHTYGTYKVRLQCSLTIISFIFFVLVIHVYVNFIRIDNSRCVSSISILTLRLPTHKQYVTTLRLLMSCGDTQTIHYISWLQQITNNVRQLGSLSESEIYGWKSNSLEQSPS